jgi:hypothetical protein
MLDTLSIVDDGRGWTIRHNGAVLGEAADEAQALSLARGLMAWLDDRGRPAELITERRSWAADGL